MSEKICNRTDGLTNKFIAAEIHIFVEWMLGLIASAFENRRQARP